jgi:[ribosomal protein S18]-alanine N-acetyltransferase
MPILELSYRSMRRDDLDAIMAIEALSFPDCWQRVAFEDYLARAQVMGRVALESGQLVAFCVFLIQGRSLHVANMAVHPEHRRAGIGRRTLEDVIAFASTLELNDVHLEVRESNLAAQLLYRKAGFRAERILRRYYGVEDGYEMRRRLVAGDDCGDRPAGGVR